MTNNVRDNWYIFDTYESALTTLAGLWSKVKKTLLQWSTFTRCSNAKRSNPSATLKWYWIHTNEHFVSIWSNAYICKIIAYSITSSQKCVLTQSCIVRSTKLLQLGQCKSCNNMPTFLRGVVSTIDGATPSPVAVTTSAPNTKFGLYILRCGLATDPRTYARCISFYVTNYNAHEESSISIAMTKPSQKERQNGARILNDVIIMVQWAPCGWMEVRCL